MDSDLLLHRDPNDAEGSTNMGAESCHKPRQFFAHTGNAECNRNLVANISHKRLIKASIRLVRHARNTVFQAVEATLMQQVLVGLVALINGLGGPPVTTVSR